MDIILSKEAVNFFKTEFDIAEGEGVRIKAKMYGSTNVHTYISVMIEVTKPKNPYALVDQDGLTVFVEQSEEWFVTGLDLEIDFNKQEGIPTYYFISQDNRVLDNSEYTRNYPSQHFM